LQEAYGKEPLKKAHKRVRSMEMKNELMIVPKRKELALMAQEPHEKIQEESKKIDSGNTHTRSSKSIKISTAVTTNSATPQADFLTLLTRTASSNGIKTNMKIPPPAECQVKTAEGRREQCLLANYIEEIHRNNKRYPQTTIEFYEISTSVGKGSFGEVYLAIQKLTGYPVAIKIFDKSQLKTDYKKQKIVQEVNIMKRINHPNAIRLLEVFEDSETVYLVMEWAEKGDLLQIMKRQNNRIPEFQAQKYFKQILAAVSWLHSEGILHRDLKLDNILIGAKNQIKLCDFGISKFMPINGEVVKEKCGTPAYNSPEIIINEGYSGFQSDVWSLGILLYAMCSARVPFFAETVEDLYKIVLQGEYEIPRDFSKNLADLISRMLVLNPKKRISLQEVKEHPWVSTGYCSDPKEKEPNPGPLEIKQELVKMVESFGFSKAYIEKSVSNCVLNHAFSCYYTLYKGENP
jgi:serine/threonine protein kinase